MLAEVETEVVEVITLSDIYTAQVVTIIALGFIFGALLFKCFRNR